MQCVTDLIKWEGIWIITEKKMCEIFDCLYGF